MKNREKIGSRREREGEGRSERTTSQYNSVALCSALFFS